MGARRVTSPRRARRRRYRDQMVGRNGRSGWRSRRRRPGVRGRRGPERGRPRGRAGAGPRCRVGGGCGRRGRRRCRGIRPGPVPRSRRPGCGRGPGRPVRRSPRFSRRSSASSLRPALVRPPSSLVPASRSACLTHSRTAVSVRSKSFATWPADRSPRWHSSTISALNSGVNERRRRGFFPMLSMIGHPSGGKPLMMDVRQSGSGPERLASLSLPGGGRRVVSGGCRFLGRRGSKPRLA
jgi:hypothetical protein